MAPDCLQDAERLRASSHSIAEHWHTPCRSTEYLADLCGYYELSDAQRCVLQELEQAMTRVSHAFPLQLKHHDRLIPDWRCCTPN